MKMTKRLAAIAATAVMAMTSAMGMSASAKNVTNPYDQNHPNDFMAYSHIYSGEYSGLFAGPTLAQLTSTHNDYDGSYKFVSYITYEYNSSGNLVVQSNKNNSGTSNPVNCYQSVNAATGVRDYTATLRKTSEFNSPTADNYSIVIRK